MPVTQHLGEALRTSASHCQLLKCPEQPRLCRACSKGLPSKVLEQLGHLLRPLTRGQRQATDPQLLQALQAISQHQAQMGNQERMGANAHAVQEGQQWVGHASDSPMRTRHATQQLGAPQAPASSPTVGEPMQVDDGGYEDLQQVRKGKVGHGVEGNEQACTRIPCDSSPLSMPSLTNAMPFASPGA